MSPTVGAEIVNLRRVRKRAARRDEEAAADRNRRLHGLTKAQRVDARRETEARNRALDNSYLSKTGDADDA